MNNILGWKGLPGTNTLGYYEHSFVTNINSLVTFCPGLLVVPMGRDLSKVGPPEGFYGLVLGTLAEGEDSVQLISTLG
jgi:hypothetical protein